MKQEPIKKITPKLPNHGKTPKFPSVPAQRVTVNVPTGGYTGANTSNRITGGQ
jgi:hypothetical protein